MTRSRPRVPARRLVAVLGLAAATAFGAAACRQGPEASGDVTAGAATDGAIAIVAVDNAFEPTEVRVPSGEATLEVRNDGGRDHNLVIDELDVSTGTLSPGDVVTATVEVPEGGVEFVCTFHGGMRGRLVPA